MIIIGNGIGVATVKCPDFRKWIEAVIECLRQMNWKRYIAFIERNK